MTTTMAGLALPTDRARLLTGAFDRAMVDGSIVVVNDTVGDLLVDNGSIRDLSRVLAAHAATMGMSTLRYTLAGLAQALNAPGGPEARVPSGIGDRTPPTVAIDVLIESCLRDDATHLLIFDFGEHLMPDDRMQPPAGDVARIVEQIAHLATDSGWRLSGNRVFIVGRTAPIDERVTRLPGVALVELGLPQLDERRRGLELMAASPRHPLELASGLSLEQASRLSGGISLHELSAMRHHSSQEHPLGVEHILARKRVAIRDAAGDSLIVHDQLLNIDTDVAGLPQVRRMLAEEHRRGNHSLRVILAGPPGNGKTRVSTAIAASLGVPALELGRIRARYVGESEDNLRRALDAIEANAPALLIVDEADQSGLGRRGDSAGAEGSEVTASLRAALFAWLGDTGSQLGISVVGLTNRPDLLDTAATDRFSILPVLHPSPWEAAHIMSIQARREGIAFDADGAALALVEGGSAFSGRQAVRLLSRAQVHAQEAGRQAVRGEDVGAAIAESMQSLGPEEERQSLLAIQATSWSAHLPWNASHAYGDTKAAPPGYLERFVDADGAIDRAGIADRIAELELRRGY